MFKARAKVFWWAIKYGSKQNIPPELIFNEIDRTIASLKDNMMQAFRLDDLSSEERKDTLKILGKIDELDSGLKDVK
jgi:hypothetical protein